MEFWQGTGFPISNVTIGLSGPNWRPEWVAYFDDFYASLVELDNDRDDDGILDVSDNCIDIPNADQANADGDSYGDACDSDDDNDTILDNVDNCQFIANADQADADSDGIGNACDGDLDGDGADNSVDNCPTIPNSGQFDFDGDHFGDACDPDIDGDGIANGADLCADTELGNIVEPVTGCSLAQLCPCEGPRGTNVNWRNQGKFVSCVAKSAENFMELGLITEAQKDEIVSSAAQSSCGDK